MSAYVPAVLRRRVCARFVDRCAYCLTAETLIAAIFAIEHIIPRSAGGETVFDNLCLACPTCHRSKAYRQAAVVPLLGHTVPLFHPQHQLWEKHFVWNAEATIILDLTPIGQATIEALRMNRVALDIIGKRGFARAEASQPRGYRLGPPLAPLLSPILRRLSRPRGAARRLAPGRSGGGTLARGREKCL
jgi:hypothetical protein